MLFPGVELPLHIFEPRYRVMMADALAGDRQLGMVLLAPGWEQKHHDAPPIHRVGCKGEIRDEQQLPDGRWNLILRGHSRFYIDSELETDKPYRIARAIVLSEPVDEAPGDEASLRANQLMLAVRRLLGDDEQSQRITSSLFGDAPLLSLLVDRVAAVLPIPAQAKQQLLETLSPIPRMELLLATLDAIATAVSAGDDTPRRPQALN